MPAPLVTPSSASGKPKPSQLAPPNWPPTVPYLPHPVPHVLLPKHLIPRYCTPVPPPSTHAGQGATTKIARIADPAHPAFGQYGLFAARKIKPKEWILDYTGVVHDQAGTDLASNYDLCLELLPICPEQPAGPELIQQEGQPAQPVYWDIAVDAAKSGNAARFINDFRGVPGKTRPNVEFRSRKVEVSTKSGKVEVVRIGIWAGKDGVAKGEELVLSYGRAFWKARRREEEEAAVVEEEE